MERLRNCGGSLTIPCKGSLIVPSGNIDTLPLINEFNLDPRRLTTAQSPLGGVNGLVDYAPGSVHVTEGDGIYLTDVAGNNTSKDLPAGLLSRLGYLTVDTVAHSITEEFIVSNTATSNNPTVIDACDATTGWSILYGSGIITSDGTLLTVSGNADVNGNFIISKTISAQNLSQYNVFGFNINSNVPSSAHVLVGSNTGNYVRITTPKPAVLISPNVPSRINMAFKAPALVNTGANPQTIFGTPNWSAVTLVRVGVLGAGDGTAVTFTVSNITVDVAKPAYIETAVPDNITSVVFQKWTGSTYETNCIANMDSVYSTTFLDSAKVVLNDGTKFDDVYGSGNGRSRFIKGVAGQAVDGSLAGTQMGYSGYKGTKNRIGLRVDLPPSDGGRTAFNQCRIKKIIYYDDVNKAYNILPDVSGNGNNGTMSNVGLTADNLGNPCGAMSFNGVNSLVNYGAKQNFIFGNGTTDSPFSLYTRVKLISVMYAGFFIKFVSTTNGEYYLITSAGQLYFRCFDSSLTGYIGRKYTTVIPANTWLDIVATYDGSCSANGMRIYVNGARVDDTDVNANVYIAMENKNLELLTGKNTTYYQNGLSANNRIYSRVLSPTEVTALYNNQPVSSTGLVAQWQPSTVSHMGQSTHEFSNDNNASTGLLNIAKPWLAIIDPTTKQLDYYLFTERLTSLNYKRDESGNIYEVIVNPGNGLVYKGSTVWANNTLDTNSDSKPDMLDATIQNSIAQMLSVYGFNQ